MPRLFFICSYDGAHFSGWQSQPNGKGGQDCVEAAMQRILKYPVRVTASGRTDAGVHAHAQPFHVDIAEDCRMDDRAWLCALNAHLPAAMRVMSVQRVEPSFHARFSAKAKTYEYVIERSLVLSPFLYKRVWYTTFPFDVQVLEEAFKSYLGKHDFRMFAAKRGNEPEQPPEGFFERTIYAVSVQEQGSQVRLRVTGNGFMYRMVRMLVGTAHRVACGKMSKEELLTMIQSPSHQEKTRFCAPAEGLYLCSVDYSGE